MTGGGWRQTRECWQSADKASLPLPLPLPLCLTGNRRTTDMMVSKGSTLVCTAQTWPGSRVTCRPAMANMPLPTRGQSAGEKAASGGSEAAGCNQPSPLHLTAFEAMMACMDLRAMANMAAATARPHRLCSRAGNHSHAWQRGCCNMEAEREEQ